MEPAGHFEGLLAVGGGCTIGVGFLAQDTLQDLLIDERVIDNQDLDRHVYLVNDYSSTPPVFESLGLALGRGVVESRVITR